MEDNYWEQKWKNQQTGWDIGYASPAIINFFKNIDNKHAAILIPGCGNAYEAEVLYDLGFKNITLVDISETATSKLKAKFHDKPEIKVLLQDFFELQGSFDFIVEQTFFCALLPIQRALYVQKMESILKPDGSLIGLLFNREYDSGPPFGGSKDEYLVLFASTFNIIKLENSQDSIPQRAGSELFIQMAKKIGDETLRSIPDI